MIFGLIIWITDSNAKLNNLQIPLPLQQQLFAKMNPNFHQFNEQMFFNMRPPPPEMMPEMQLFMNPGVAVPQPTIGDDMRPNDLNLETDYKWVNQCLNYCLINQIICNQIQWRE